MRILIFRTDRFGDFIVTNIAINSLHERPDTKIDIVCSKKNFEYIKKFKSFENIYIFEKSYIKFFLKNFEILKKNYDYIFIYDGKKRSHVISFFLRGTKLSLVKSFSLYKIAKFFGYKVYFNLESLSQLGNFNFLNLLVDIKSKKIDFYKNFIFDTSLKLKNEYKDSNVFHLDEKWFKGYYYHDFDYCCFDETLLDNILNIYNKKTKSKLVISTGHVKVDFIENIKNTVFKKINDNEFIHKKYGNIFLLVNTTFTQFEYFLKKNCKNLIACEGGVTHVSHNLSIHTYAFYQKGRERFYEHWTKHMPKVKLFKRPTNNEELLNFFSNCNL